MRNRFIASLATVALAALPASVLAGTPASAPEPEESIARGEALWEDGECADCHIHAAEPGQPTVPLSHLLDRFNEDSLAAFLSAPPRPMPDLGLDSDARRELARYLLATFR